MARTGRSGDGAPPGYARPMRHRTRPVLASGLAAVAGGGLWTATAADAGGRCGDQPCRADVDISGHAEPQPIRLGQTSQLKFTVKNDGPDGALGVVLQTTVPYDLRIIGIARYGGLSCSQQGTFVKCSFGDFRREQEGLIRITVKPRKTGFFHVKAIEYDADGTDPNGGNGQVTATLGVLRAVKKR